MALTSAQRVELIQKMYVAYYGRPADTGGLDNWINHLVQHNDDATAIIQAFGTSPEATSLYGEPVNYALAVNALYMQMFNRPAEPDGLALYVAHLNAGRVTLPNLALAIATGAQNSDATTLANKIEVATAFTAEVATSTDNILGYVGADAAAHAAAYLASVTSTDASVTAALANLDSTIDTINHLDQLSSLPTHELTTGLDNLLGTNGNDVALAVLDGADSTLELDDAFNGLMGQDTLRLDAVVDGTEVTFDSADYHFTNVERVLVQARADDLNINLDLADMAGVDLEVRNMIGGDADLNAVNIGGDVLVVNFDGYNLDINNVGGDVALRDINFDNYDGADLVVSGVAGSVSLDTVDGYDGDNDSNTVIYDIGGDVTVTDLDADWVGVWDVAGNVSMTTVDANDNIGIWGVGGNVSLEDIYTDDNLEVYDVVGDVTISDAYVDYNTYLVNIGGDITLTDVNANENIHVVFASDVANATINLNNVWVDYEMHINGANTLDENGNVVTEAGSLTAVTLNVNDVVMDGIELTSYEDESAGLSNISSLTINAIGDLTVDYIDFAYDSDDNDVPTTLTVNGNGDVAIAGVYNDDFLDVVYTGAGSLMIGDGNDAFDPTNGSFNASTAAGSVTVALDLNEAIDGELDFTYTGSKGTDRVIIEEDSLGDAVADSNTVHLSLVGGNGVDTLVVSDDSDLSAAAMAAISGFEVLEIYDWVDDESFDLTNTHSDFTSIVIAGDWDTNYNTLELINLSAQQAGNITITSAGDDNTFSDLTIGLKNATGLNDTVTLNYVASADENSLNYIVYDTMYLDDIENLNINATGSALDVNENEHYAAFNYIDANELEKITITGNVNVWIEGTDTQQLKSIDARAFTGANLTLGWYSDVIWTDDDLVIQGALAADHNINVNGNEDVTVTTGSGDDNIYVDALDKVVINAGDGDNNVNAWSLDDDITVTTGSGADDINIYGGDGGWAGNVVITSGAGNDSVYIDGDVTDVTVTLGDGDDDFNYNDDGIDGDLVVNAGAGDDNINIHLNTDSNIESITVTLGAGADELWIESTRFDANNDVVAVVTDFTVADDVLYLDEGFGEGVSAEYVTVTTKDGDYDFTDANANIALVEFTFNADNNSVTFDNPNGYDLLEALGDDGDTASILVDGGQEGYIVAYNGGDAYIFNFDTSYYDAAYVSEDVYDDGGSFEGDHEDAYFYIDAGDEGFTAGDVINLYDVAYDGGYIDVSYTIQQTGESLVTVLADLTALINGNVDSLYAASYDVSGYIYLTSYGEVDLVDVTGDYVNNYDLVTADEIELVGVLEGVAVGTLTQSNFDFYNF